MAKIQPFHAPIISRPPKVSRINDSRTNITSSNPSKNEHAWTKQIESMAIGSSASKKEFGPRENIGSNQRKAMNSMNPPSQGSTGGKSTTFKVFIAILGILIGGSALAGLGLGLYTVTQTSTTKISTTIIPIKEWRWRSTAITVAGTGVVGVLPGYLENPYHVTTDSSNAIYVADYDNNRIVKYTKSSSIGTTVAGQASGVFGSTAYDLFRPIYVLVDKNGHLYVSDFGNHRIQFFNGTSLGITVAGVVGVAGTSLSHLNGPSTLVQDPNTNFLYVADTSNHRIIRFTPGSMVGVVVAGGNGPGTSITQLYSPMGLHLDLSSNSLFIVNFQTTAIVRWVLGATSWTLIAGNALGTTGVTPNYLNKPTFLLVDSFSNLYVSDTYNARIQLFKAGQANGSTIAGVSGVHGSTAQHLYYPYGIAFDSEFNLYVADTANHRIQMFERY